MNIERGFLEREADLLERERRVTSAEVLRRDRFAAAALTGLLASGRGYVGAATACASHAREQADALLAALDGSKP